MYMYMYTGGRHRSEAASACMSMNFPDKFISDVKHAGTCMCKSFDHFSVNSGNSIIMYTRTTQPYCQISVCKEMRDRLKKAYMHLRGHQRSIPTGIHPKSTDYNSTT